MRPWTMFKVGLLTAMTMTMVFHWEVEEAKAEVIIATEETKAPAEDIFFVERVPEGYWENAGRHRITHYCPERCCNGSNAWKTASGEPMVVGRTVAASSKEFDFGTRLLINGMIYVVEDRGVGKGCIDILVESHKEALDKGRYYTDVHVWRDYPITDGKVINDLK